jgi:hypothetical protein
MKLEKSVSTAHAAGESQLQLHLQLGTSHLQPDKELEKSQFQPHLQLGNFICNRTCN